MRRWTLTSRGANQAGAGGIPLIRRAEHVLDFLVWKDGVIRSRHDRRASPAGKGAQAADDQVRLERLRIVIDSSARADGRRLYRLLRRTQRASRCGAESNRRGARSVDGVDAAVARAVDPRWASRARPDGRTRRRSPARAPSGGAVGELRWGCSVWVPVIWRILPRADTIAPDSL